VHNIINKKPDKKGISKYGMKTLNIKPEKNGISKEGIKISISNLTRMTYQKRA
jgi:hypothetical protein